MNSGQDMFNEILKNASSQTKSTSNVIGESMKSIFPRVNRIDTTPVMDKEKLVEKLFDYFCFNTKDGTYIYNLTRVKEAFHVGTMTLDDFEEIDEEFIYELADFILEIMPSK